MDPQLIAILMFASLFVAIFAGHPLAFALGGLAVIFGLVFWEVSPDVVFAGLSNKTMGVMSDYVLVAVPLFIFMAQMLDASGVAESLFNAMYVVLGPIRGGLGVAVILVCTIFAASAGVVGATEVAVGLLAAPALMKRGYDIPLTAGAICAGGTLGIIIPPSIMLVFYGSLANLSVGQLFTAAMAPGLLLATLYIAYIIIRCGINPSLGPPMPKEERTHTFGQKVRMVMFGLVPPMFLILLVLGSILFGVATPTEAAGIGCTGSVLLAIFYRKLTWTAVKNACLATLTTTSMILALAVGGNAFQAVFMILGGGDVIADLLLGMQVSPYVVLYIMMGCVFLLGMFIDWIGILLIIVPIFMPIAYELGFNPIWFSTLICVNLQMAFLTPPFGYSMFYLKGIAPKEMTMIHIYKGVVPFIILQWVALIICVSYPDFVLWIPRLLFGEGAV
jgi:tripartite ATP-independent transporter DctM subunit